MYITVLQILCWWYTSRLVGLVLDTLYSTVNSLYSCKCSKPTANLSISVLLGTSCLCVVNRLSFFSRHPVFFFLIHWCSSLHCRLEWFPSVFAFRCICIIYSVQYCIYIIKYTAVYSCSNSSLRVAHALQAIFKCRSLHSHKRETSRQVLTVLHSLVTLRCYVAIMLRLYDFRVCLLGCTIFECVCYASSRYVYLGCTFYWMN